MSVTGATSEVSPAVARQGRPAGFGHILLSEWTKIRSVRSTIWSLITYVVLTIGLSALLLIALAPTIRFRREVARQG